jgi:hypothetical protein
MPLSRVWGVQVLRVALRVRRSRVQQKPREKGVDMRALYLIVKQCPAASSKVSVK